jgi:hypothetical protein
LAALFSQNALARFNVSWTQSSPDGGLIYQAWPPGAEIDDVPVGATTLPIEFDTETDDRAHEALSI